jgi:5-methylcytosine-specific restriction endonuclease McrA
MGRYVEGYNRLPDGRNIWLVQADEKEDDGWNWDHFFQTLPERFEQWGGDEWIHSTSSIKRVRDEFREGDLVVCYQAAPTRAVVGLARISSEGYAIVRRRRKPGGTFFDMDWGCRLDPVSFETLRLDPVLSNMEKVRFAQGSVFRVSPAELVWLLAMTEPTSVEVSDVESALNISWPIAPTSNVEDLERRAAMLLKAGPVARPSGVRRPKAVERTALQYQRDPSVRAFVLQEAKGTCELCGEAAPFTSADGLPYLEVHHVQQLAHGGPDTVENAVALCPNCHRRLHLSDDAAVQVERLRSKVARLAGGSRRQARSSASESAGETLLPDLGLYLKEKLGPQATYNFVSFPVSMLGRVSTDTFSTTANMAVEGRTFAVTLDFDRDHLKELLATMPKNIAQGIGDHFSRPFERPQVLNLPVTVEVAVESCVGGLQENKAEQYLPLAVTKFERAH